MSEAEEAFRNLVVYCASVPEFVEQFNRLTGCNLGQSVNRSQLDRLIDEATGYSGESKTDMQMFVAFVHDTIWARLMVEPTQLNPVVAVP